MFYGTLVSKRGRREAKQYCLDRRACMASLIVHEFPVGVGEIK